MERKADHRPGDIILDRYVPHLGPEDREIARERLRQWMRLKLAIYMERVRADSREVRSDDTMESAPKPPP